MLLAFKNYCNILALLKLPLAFTKGHIVILGETHEHGDVFFYIMPSNMGPQRATSNHVHEQLVIVF
jgi:hypothetical protein